MKLKIYVEGWPSGLRRGLEIRFFREFISI